MKYAEELCNLEISVSEDIESFLKDQYINLNYEEETFDAHQAQVAGPGDYDVEPLDCDTA